MGPDTVKAKHHSVDGATFELAVIMPGTANGFAEFTSMPSLNGFIVGKSRPICDLSLGEPQHGDPNLTSDQDPR